MAETPIHRSSEDALRKTALLLDSVRQAQSLYIEKGDPQTVFDTLLEILISITDSEFGFLDEVRYEPDGTPYKVSLAISNISWNAESRALYEQLRAKKLEFRNLDNLSGLPAKLHKPIIANAAPTDKRSGGLPPGHPPIRSFMGLPVSLGEEIVGVIGVANRDEGYDKDMAHFLEPYLSTCAGIIYSIRLGAKEEKAVAALESERAFLSAVLDNIQESIIICNEEGQIIRFNEAARRLHGLPEKPISPDQWAEHYDLYETDAITRLPKKDIPLFRALNGERVRNAEVVVSPKKQDPHFLACNGQVLNDAAGHRIGALVTMHDITERKRAEESLRQSEDKFRTLVDQAPEALFLHNTDGRIVDVNQAALTRYGYSRDQFLRMTASDIDPDYVEREDGGAFWQNLKAQNQIRFEARHRRKDGSIFPVDVSLSAIKLGREKFILALAEDISDRKQAEAERRKLQDQLLQAQKMETVGRLAGGVAHDFNNMLGIIIANAELSEMQIGSDSPVYNSIQEILKASNRAADTVRYLLAFARKQIISPKILDLNDTIYGALDMLRRLIGEDIHLRLVPGKDLWKVRMDPSQTHQILTNLVVNSRDAMPNGGTITIETKNAVLDASYCQNHKGVEPGDYVTLAVTDTGDGIAPEVMDHLFDPFFTTKEVGKGTGLGLPMVYGAIKQNNGHVEIHSELGAGATVRLYLPRVEEEASKPKEKVIEKTVPGGNETVLVAEDERALLDTCRYVLERQGYTVLTARNPKEALEIAEKHPGEIDLLLTDVVMPDMNGKKLAEKLQAMRPHLKTLFMSGYTADVMAQRGILEQEVTFIQKPFNFTGLAEKVRGALDKE